jgi:hypothetical protein
MAHKKKKTAPRGLGDLARFGGRRHAMTDEPLPAESGDSYRATTMPRTLGDVIRAAKKKGAR